MCVYASHGSISLVPAPVQAVLLLVQEAVSALPMAAVARVRSVLALVHIGPHRRRSTTALAEVVVRRALRFLPAAR